jgi:UDP-glucose 4-epimerase
LENILITGSSGFIGQHLVQTLKIKNNRLFLHSRKQEVKKSSFDLYNLDSVSKFINDHEITTVIHLASDVKALRKNNTNSNEQLFINAEKRMANNLFSSLSKGSKFIYFSTALEYESSKQPISEEGSLKPGETYSKAKYETRIELEGLNGKGDLNLIILRPFIVYGNNQPENMFVSQMIESIRSKKQFVFSSHNIHRDFLHVSDLTEAISLILESKDTLDGVYNIGTGIGHSLLQLVELIDDIKGFEIEYVRDSKLGVGSPEYLVSDSTKIKKALNWEPKIKLKVGISELINSIIKD